MGRQTGYLFGFNAGVISKEMLQRVDLAATKVAAEIQTNMLPRVLGAAVFRPGTQYLFETHESDSGRLIPFVFNTTERALIELTKTGNTRFIVDEVPIARVATSTSIANGTFTSNLASWTDSDEAGATSDWLTGGFMRLLGTGGTRAIRDQNVSVAVGDQNKEHGLRIVIAQGPVYFSVGTTAGGAELLAEQTLGTGIHSLAVTPTGANMHLRFSWDGTYPVLVDSIAVEAAGNVVITNPWNTNTKMRAVQFAQSGDVIYCAQRNHKQRKIERRSQRSWSIVEYQPIDGPFRPENVSSTTIDPSGTSGSITLTASRALFSSGHVGSVWRITHGQSRYVGTASAADQFIGPIRVSGLARADLDGGSLQRAFRVQVTFSGGADMTVTLQRAFGTPTQWVDFENYPASGGNIDKQIADGRSNEIIFYRLGVKTGDYTSGTADLLLRYVNQSQSGLVRITAVASATSATADVLSQLGDPGATRLWNEPEWSDARGWPGAVTLFDGRLWWGGFDKTYGSISDAFEAFDEEFEGDAGPIIRSIANGPFERVIWMLGAIRLLCGTASEEVSIRASSFDEPLTPGDFTARSASQRGSAEDLPAIRIDSLAVFVQRNLKRVYQMGYSVESQDYVSSDLTRLAPEICEPGIVAIAAQRQPDTRIWFVLSDGTAACLLYERDDDATAWVKVTMSGLIKDVTVLPGNDEDDVYFTVRRVINGNPLFTVEKLAKLSEVVGGTLNKVMDGHVVYSGGSTTTISGLDHLIGRKVVVWADGAPVHTQDNMLTVDGDGEIELASPVTNAVVGLPYDGQFLSARLNYGGALGAAIGKPQKIAGAYLLMKDVGPAGIKVGQSLSTLFNLPATYEGRATTATEVIASYTHDLFPGGGFDRNARLAFEVKSPFPATLLGVAVDIETGEGIEAQRG